MSFQIFLDNTLQMTFLFATRFHANPKQQMLQMLEEKRADESQANNYQNEDQIE